MQVLPCVSTRDLSMVQWDIGTKIVSFWHAYGIKEGSPPVMARETVRNPLVTPQSWLVRRYGKAAKPKRFWHLTECFNAFALLCFPGGYYHVVLRIYLWSPPLTCNNQCG